MNRLGLSSAVVLAVGCALAGCGSSSSSKSASVSSTTAGAASVPSTTPGASTAARPTAAKAPPIRQAITKLDACVRENGIKLHPGSGGYFGLGGVNTKTPAFKAALKKCRAQTRGSFHVAYAQEGKDRRERLASSPQYKQSILTYAACLRENGITNHATPNTSGEQPILNITGLNLESPLYKAAFLRCIKFFKEALVMGVIAGGQSKAKPGTTLTTKVDPAFKHALQKFTACMREKGLKNFPEPEGATINISHSHLDTSGPQYKAAELKCNPILTAALLAHPDNLEPRG
jgi:hypothetical protein